MSTVCGTVASKINNETNEKTDKELYGDIRRLQRVKFLFRKLTNHFKAKLRG